MPSRNPYGCVFWPTYLLPFLGRDAAALVRLPLAARGAAGCLRLAGAGVAACVSAAPAFATGAAPPPPPPTPGSPPGRGRLESGFAPPTARPVRPSRAGPPFHRAS